MSTPAPSSGHGPTAGSSSSGATEVVVGEGQIKFARSNQIIKYPSVNSCITVTCKFHSGNGVGCHFTMRPEGEQIPADRAISEIQKICRENGEAIASINILVAGDDSTAGELWSNHKLGAGLDQVEMRGPDSVAAVFVRNFNTTEVSLAPDATRGNLQVRLSQPGLVLENADTGKRIPTASCISRQREFYSEDSDAEALQSIQQNPAYTHPAAVKAPTALSKQTGSLKSPEGLHGSFSPLSKPKPTIPTGPPKSPLVSAFSAVATRAATDKAIAKMLKKHDKQINAYASGTTPKNPVLFAYKGIKKGSTLKSKVPANAPPSPLERGPERSNPGKPRLS